MADFMDQLNAYVGEYGAERVVGWIESRLNQLEKARDPERRSKQLARAKERREADKIELAQLKAELEALRARKARREEAQQ